MYYIKDYVYEYRWYYMDEDTASLDFCYMCGFIAPENNREWWMTSCKEFGYHDPAAVVIDQVTADLMRAALEVNGKRCTLVFKYSTEI